MLFAAAFFFAIAPQLRVKAQLAKEAGEKGQMCEASLRAAKEESKKKMTDELNALKTRLSDFAVDYEESANLTFDISRIAADKQVSSFTVKAVDQAKETGDSACKNLQENRIAISFASDFRQFASFLNALERHRPVVFIDRFKVSRAGQNESGNSVDMELAIFVRKRPEG